MSINELSDNGVSPLSALQISTVWRCINLISDSIAGLPLQVVNTSDNYFTDISTHPIRKILNRPNEFMTCFSFIEWVMSSLLLNGNAYVYINKDFSGKVVELLPIPANSISVYQDENWNLIYTINFKNINQQVANSNLIHFKGMSLDGVTGLSPIACARNTIKLDQFYQIYGINYYKNGGTPKGIITTPNTLSEEAKTRLRNSFDTNFVGDSSFRTAIFEEGMRYEKLTMSNADAEYVNSRKLNVLDICRIFGVPSHLVMSSENTTTWGSGIAEQNRAFLQLTLMPWIKRLEETFNNSLFSSPSEAIRINFEGFLRGDTASRYQCYEKALQYGWLSINEIRAKEHLPPIDGGDKHYIPLNYRAATSTDNFEQNMKDQTARNLLDGSDGIND